MHHKDVACADVLVDFYGDFAIREAPHRGCAQADTEVPRDVRRHAGVGIAGENHDIGVVGFLHGAVQ